MKVVTKSTAKRKAFFLISFLQNQAYASINRAGDGVVSKGSIPFPGTVLLVSWSMVSEE
jgi:hypothetical protein